MKKIFSVLSLLCIVIGSFILPHTAFAENIGTDDHCVTGWTEGYIPITLDKTTGTLNDTFELTLHYTQIANNNNFVTYLKSAATTSIWIEQSKDGKKWEKANYTTSATGQGDQGSDQYYAQGKAQIEAKNKGISMDSPEFASVIAPNYKKDYPYTFRISSIKDGFTHFRVFLSNDHGSCEADTGLQKFEVTKPATATRIPKGGPCKVADQKDGADENLRCEDGIKCEADQSDPATKDRFVCGGKLPDNQNKGGPASGTDTGLVGYKITPLQTDWEGPPAPDGKFVEHFIETSGTNSWSLKPGEDIISRINDMNIRDVLFTFYGLDPKSNYFLCGQSPSEVKDIVQHCINLIYSAKAVYITNDKNHKPFIQDSVPDPDNPKDPKSNLPNAVQVLACGDGDNSLKFDKSCTWDKGEQSLDATGVPKYDKLPKPQGDDLKNWFHAGHTYHATLVKFNPDGIHSTVSIVFEGAFYVNHSYPLVYINGLLAAKDKDFLYNLNGENWDKVAVGDDKAYASYIDSAQQNYDDCGVYQTGAANRGKKDENGQPIKDCAYVDGPTMSDFDVTPKGTNATQRITVALLGKRPGGDDRNHYKVSLLSDDPNFSFEDNGDNVCGTIKTNAWTLAEGKADTKAGDPPYPTFTYPSADNSHNYNNQGLSPGNYQISVAEQVDTALWKQKLLGSCRGGFEYWRIPIRITNDGHVIVSGPPVKDPNGSDLKNLKKNNIVPQSPCADRELVPQSSSITSMNGYKKEDTCQNLKTGLMTFSTDPKKFTTQLFSFVLTLGGSVAVILMAIAGYQLMTSEGDKAKLQAARERITSLIIGLLFIVFSFVILQFIAGDILQIPGFIGKNTNNTSTSTTPPNQCGGKCNSNQSCKATGTDPVLHTDIWECVNYNNTACNPACNANQTCKFTGNTDPVLHTDIWACVNN